VLWYWLEHGYHRIFVALSFHAGGPLLALNGVITRQSDDVEASIFGRLLLESIGHSRSKSRASQWVAAYGRRG
jgi:hypothetical protein